jgi:molybdopterin synthase catalytic subunit
MIQLTNETIDTNAILESVSSTHAGAVILFIGTVRDLTGDRATDSLDYECYQEMAEKKMSELEQQARDKWPIIECTIVHRLGHMKPAEASVAIAVSTAHRIDAFEAGKWLIDTLKEEVPIWKQENWSDGTKEWVHPGVEPTDQKPSGL